MREVAYTDLSWSECYFSHWRLRCTGSPVKRGGGSSEWTLTCPLPHPRRKVLFVPLSHWTCWSQPCLMGRRETSGSLRPGAPLFAQDCNSNRGASWVPTPNPPLFLWVYSFSLVTSSFFNLSRQTHVFVFCLRFIFILVGLFYPRLCQSFICPPFLPLCSLLTCELFQRNIFEFYFISTWLSDLFSCCLYIILILLWFLKFHLYYILGPRDHPDIVDSFMQLQAQVCFWFLLSFTLGFYLVLSLLCPFHSLSLLSFCSFLFGPKVSYHIGRADEWNKREDVWKRDTCFSSNTWF